MLLMAGFFCGNRAVAQDEWAVTDTVVPDGYYYICSNCPIDEIAGRGCLYVADLGGAKADYSGMPGLFIQSFQKITGELTNDLQSIFRVRRKSDGTFQIKNMGSQPETYFYPIRPIGGQADYIFAVGRESESYYFRTKDYGSSSKSSDAWTAVLNRKDNPVFVDQGRIDKGTAQGYDVDHLVGADSLFFIRPTSSLWRWRIGGSSLIKLNSYSNRISASFYLKKVEVTEEQEAWLELHGAVTDAMGLGYEFGKNPGEISSEVALEAFEKVLDQASETLDNGATNDEYYAMVTTVKNAVAEVQKYEVPLEGYVFMKNHFTNYGNGWTKFSTIFNDDAPREYATSGTLPGAYPDDTVRARIRSHCWNPETYWFGYAPIQDADMEAATAEDSKLPDQYIWKITQREDGSYNLKNCGESSVTGDSTYVFTTIKRNAVGASAWCQLTMRGTPHQGMLAQNVSANRYYISWTDNFYPLNMGNHFFNTMNPTNSGTYGQWEFYTVPEARITPKFKLNCAITDAAGVLEEWKVGNWPGQLQESYVADLRAELAKAREAYAAGTGDLDAQTASLEKVYQATIAALKDTDKVQNPIQEGYYRFVNTDTVNLQFGEQHFSQGGITTSYGKSQTIWLARDGVERYGYSKKVVGWKPSWRIYADESNGLYWDIQEKYVADETGELKLNTSFIDHDMFSTWYLSKAGTNSEGKQLWYVKNMATDCYLDMSSTGAMTLSEEPVAVLLDNNTQNTLLFNTYYYYNGNNARTTGAYVVMSPEGENYMVCANPPYSTFVPETSLRKSYLQSRDMTASSQLYAWQWLLEPVTGDALEELKVLADAKLRVIKMHSAIGDAEKALANTISYTRGDALITDAGWEGDDETGTYDPAKTQIWMNQLHTTEKIDVIDEVDGERVTTATFMNQYKNLIDGNLATYVHSRFSAAGGSIDDMTDYNSLFVDLKTPKSKIAFKVGMRGNPNITYGPLGGQPITYGATDYGKNYRPTSWVVYGANTSDISGQDTTWTEVAYIKDIPAIIGQRMWTSPMIETATPYQYYKFSCWGTVNGSTYKGFPYLVVSEFQVYDAEEDTANSPATYNTEIKKAADAVKALLADARAAYKAENVSKDQLEKFQAAVSDLEKVAPDTAQLYSRIVEAKVLNDSTYTPDLEQGEKYQYGDVTADQKAAFETAIQNAEKAMSFTSHPTKESLQKAYEDINNAYFTLLKQRKSFELDKWYYIVSTEYQGYHCRWNWNWRGNQMVYACGDIPQAPLKEGVMGNIASPVRWGHYTNFNSMPEGQTYPTSLTYDENYDKNNKGYVDYTGGNWEGNMVKPHNMWRIVQLKDSVYAVQNRANGLYLGRRQDLTNNSSHNYITLSKEPMPMQINLLGRGQYEIVPLDSTCAYYPAQADKVNPTTGKPYSPTYENNLPLHSQVRGFYMVWWGSGTERGYNTGSAYTFMEIDEDEAPSDNIEYPVKDNDICIKSFPFELNAEGGLMTTSGTASIYALKNFTVDSENNETTIELTEIKKAAAGEPFILVTGNPAEAVEGLQDSVNMYVDMSAVTEYDGTNKIVNGLVAAVYGDSIKSPGYGVFTDAVLKTTEEGKTTYVKGLSGYIDAKSVVAGTGNTDLTIKGSGILNSIEKIDEALRNGKVDVYTVDGKKVRSAVKETDAGKGLTKGVYVIGKKKVLVK